MQRAPHWLVALAAVVGLLQTSAWAAEQEEMVRNPPCEHWSAFKPGTTVTQRETTTFAPGSPEAAYYAGERIHISVYKLLEVTPDHVVVQLTTFERGPGSVTENAPVKITYPAKARKKRVLRGREEIKKFKEGKEEIKVFDKMIKAEIIEITDIEGDHTIESKIWHSDEIPGGTIKIDKKSKKGNEVLAETITEVTEFHIEK